VHYLIYCCGFQYWLVNGLTVNAWEIVLIIMYFNYSINAGNLCCGLKG
jgi:hypothetical protein